MFPGARVSIDETRSVTLPGLGVALEKVKSIRGARLVTIAVMSSSTVGKWFKTNNLSVLG